MNKDTAADTFLRVSVKLGELLDRALAADLVDREEFEEQSALLLLNIDRFSAAWREVVR